MRFVCVSLAILERFIVRNWTVFVCAKKWPIKFGANGKNERISPHRNCVKNREEETKKHADSLINRNAITRNRFFHETNYKMRRSELRKIEMEQSTREQGKERSFVRISL